MLAAVASKHQGLLDSNRRQEFHLPADPATISTTSAPRKLTGLQHPREAREGRPYGAVQ
jgi:hypothetical protein